MLRKLFVVIPCYQEEKALPITAEKLREKMTRLHQQGLIAKDSKVLLVNDGSRDKTWDVIQQLYREQGWFAGVNLTRNRGHQNALLAGLAVAAEHADMVISMDADLQDDIDAMDEMIRQYINGYDVVYGVRSSREKDTFFKRFTAEGFYKLMLAMGVDLVFNHADYRLMSRRALCALLEFPEVNLFLRGMVPQVGYPSTTVTYSRGERVAGESKYPLKKMLAFAFNGITSFSNQPIRLVLKMGMLIVVLSILAAAISLVRHVMGLTIPGWTSLFLSIWFLGGLQMVAIGVLIATQLMNLVFVPRLAAGGLSLSIGLASLVNAGTLLFLLLRRGIYTPETGWAHFALQVVAATLLLMAFLLWADESLQWITASRMQRLVQFVLVCLGAAVVYFGALLAGGFKLLEQIRR